MTGQRGTTDYPRFLPWLDDDFITRVWVAGALFMLALLAATLPAQWTDERTIDGVNVWMKPIKFQLSLAIHFITVALLAQLILRPVRTGWVFTIATYAALVSLVLEIIYIMVQAGRGRRSHFNTDTELELFLYSLMGVGAVLLVLAPMVLGILIWLRKDVEMTGLRLGAVLGCVLSGVLTIVVGGYMSGNFSHWVGQTDGDAGGLPLFGWSREVGDLRIAHFFATHMLQALPLIGLIADRVPGLPSRTLVWIGAVLSIVIIAATFLQALSGQPLIP